MRISLPAVPRVLTQSPSAGVTILLTDKATFDIVIKAKHDSAVPHCSNGTRSGRDIVTGIAGFTSTAAGTIAAAAAARASLE